MPNALAFDKSDNALLVSTIRAGSKSFDTACLLLPFRYRLAARALYAFCRSSDDAVDEGLAGDNTISLLRLRLSRIYAGNPGPLLEDRAFALVAGQFAIPKEIPLSLIEGFEWDEQGRRYDTIDSLLDYAARVAATVGIMMCLIMGRRDSAVLSRAAELGLAMQLTNIARDVGEDAARGRIYLPLDWLREAAIDPDEFLANPRMSPQIGRVVERLLGVAEKFYQQSFRGIAGLPYSCRPAIRSAGLIYRGIGTAIRANGHDSVNHRAHTSAAHKLALAGWGSVCALIPASVPSHAAHGSVFGLVDCAAEPTRPAAGFDGAIGRLVDVLASLEARERQSTLAARSRLLP